jgi:tetratricopeptide (TPR) repeat protein|tara:strand:+ start:267 stop:752 length:486 start_codon:yes stop_codon:yes gene_type:complete
MIKKFLVSTIFLVLLSSQSNAAGSNSDAKPKTHFDKAVTYIKAAKKLEKKGDLDKAQKRYKRAIKFLLKSNKDNPNKPDTLNYLGFATRKIGDFDGGEKYYLQGLAIKPNHIGINEYLGELYVATNRINLAQERLKVLENCNCKEYEQLKAVIDGTKKSKY